MTAKQAESAHSQATELDDDIVELIDQDQREEEETLQGRYVNPQALTTSVCAGPPKNWRQTLLA